jgi:aminoglycoside phosphotransferase (APT) family kinase protein
MTADYGFCDDETNRRLLRSPPPRGALAWAEEAIGGRVISARALRGGLSSAVHALTVELAGGRTRQVVLRRYVRPELNEEEPDIAEREARVLPLLDTVDVPTPAFIAADLSGSVPAILMSYLPGKVEWSPADTDHWLAGLASLLPPIHAARLPAPGVIRPFAPYYQASYAPPDWARRPEVWKRGLEIFHGPAPDEPSVFIHRDFHPGNVLWEAGALSGVVDWQAASIGPPSADVAHCRANLWDYGIELADRFTAIWERLTGARYHPWADVMSILGDLDWLRADTRPERYIAEDVLTRAVAELDG